tara:strand:+ start:107844 stop:107951 length:108 start_codon:yes stop_codon:yes gene_type:complete
MAIHCCMVPAAQGGKKAEFITFFEIAAGAMAMTHE